MNSVWKAKIDNAIKNKKLWEEEFECDNLVKHYKGKSNKSKYTLNLIYATIKRKKAQIGLQEPMFHIKPRAGKVNWDPYISSTSASIKQDVLNAVVSNPAMDFTTTLELVLLDSFFRFGVVEVGYAADWKHPSKPHVHMKSDEEEELSKVSSEDPNKDKVVENEEVLAEERVFVKWIPSKRFYVVTGDNPKLKGCLWCGYYSFMRYQELKQIEGVKFPDNYQPGSLSAAFPTGKLSLESRKDEEVNYNDSDLVCKVWHIWDNVTKTRLLILDDLFEVLWEGPFERIPFSAYRFDLLLDSWYPLPPVSQWLGAQNEINDGRQQVVRYRKRFNRKYEYDKGTMEMEELEKFLSGEDGTLIEVKQRPTDGNNAIRPIQNPEIGISITEGLISAKDDFNIVASNTIARGRVGDRQTATATKVQAAAEEVAQTQEQADFRTFVAEVGREILLQIAENFETGVMVKLTQDPAVGSFMEEYEEMKDSYEYVTASMLNDDVDFDIIVKAGEASPEEQAIEEAAFIKFITLVRDYSEIRMSPTLIREAAFKVGYKNEKVIKEYQKMAQLVLMEKANMANASLAQQGLVSNASPSQVGQSMLSGPQSINASVQQLQQ